MKNVISVACFLLLTLLGYAQQSLNDYSYVVVPEQYDFVTGKDRYQLNSMTKFYLNKHGFNAFLYSEVPNVMKCDGLYADVIKENAILNTKLVLVLKDCKDNIIFKSNEGVSKFKEWDAAYQDALRDIFKSFNTLDVSQKDIVVYDQKETISTVDDATTKSDSESTAVVKKNTAVVTTSSDAKTTTLARMPTTQYANYTCNGKSYLLRKTNDGFSLYEDTETANLVLQGKISLQEAGLKFTDTAANSYDAYFDEAYNLTIFKDDTPETYTVQR